MEEILSSISPEFLLLFGINFLFLLIMLFMNLSNRSKIKKLKSKFNKFMDISGDKNLEDMLEKCIDMVNDVADKNRELEKGINFIEREMFKCIQKVGVIRYNAFDNVGSDLSFSIALLDNNDTGVVISGIYSRDSSSTYAKPIVGSKSKYTLSAEEIQALDLAKKSSRERTYMD